MADNLITEEYIIREYEKQFAYRMRTVCLNLGSPGAGRDAHGEGWVDKNWSRDNHKMWISYNGSHRKFHGANDSNAVTFKNFRYNPETSKVVYGTPQIINTSQKPVPGKSFHVDNRGGESPSTLHINEKITLDQGVEHTIGEHVEMNVTSETSLKGSYGGVEAEAKFTLAFGVAFDNSETQSESKSTESEFSDDYIVPAGKNYLIALVHDSIIEDTPFTVEGYFDCDIDLDIDDYAGTAHLGHLDLWNSGARRSSHDHRLKSSGLQFSSFTHLERFFKGYDVDYPKMKDFLSRCSPGCRKSLEWIFEESHRKVSVSGIKRREFDDNITITHTEVTA